MPATLSIDRLADLLRPGLSLYWPGCAGHSALFEDWWRALAGRSAGVTVCGVWIPGVNRFDPTAGHEGARAAGFFMTPALRSAWDRGAFDLQPLAYSEIARQFAQPGRFDAALIQVAPPDADGRCSLALAADFTPAVLRGLAPQAPVLAHLNPRLPRTCGPSVPAARISAWIEAATEPLTVAEEAPGAALQALGTVVAGLVRDGDTLQLGLGRLQAAVLAALRGHRRLRIHSGMVSDGLLGLIEAGALALPAPGRPPVCTGVALGSAPLHAAVADADQVCFAPVEHTHAQATLAAIPNLVSINAALQVDLLGNVNGEMLDGRQVSGMGGLVDFLRGARASAGGRAIVALPAAAGAASRIVPLLPAAAVGVSRAEVDIVATEHGAVALRGLGVQARAQALIGIAAPAHREALAQAWHTLRRAL